MIVPSPVTYRTITASNTTLFALAVYYMNDATRWNEIAAINGLIDPWINEAVTLKVPDGTGQGNGGILGL